MIPDATCTTSKKGIEGRGKVRPMFLRIHVTSQLGGIIVMLASIAGTSSVQFFLASPVILGLRNVD